MQPATKDNDNLALLRQFAEEQYKGAPTPHRGLTVDNLYRPEYLTAGNLQLAGGSMTLCSAAQGAQTFTTVDLGFNG